MSANVKDYRIVVDTGCDLDRGEEKNLKIVSVPFKIEIDENSFIDDENLDIEEFLKAMEKTKDPIRTACPSPMDYAKKLEGLKEADGIFVFTISKKLSGSFNAAKVAVDIFKEDNPKTPICLIDTESASAGQTNVAYKALDLIKKGLDFEAIQKEMESFIEGMKTFFILESLENLKKNGRIRKSTTAIANALRIRPIMCDDGQGEIELFQINRGFKKSIKKLSEHIIQEYNKKELKMLTISHVNALDKANDLKNKILEEVSIEEVILVHTKGLASGYADIGGIVVAF